MNRLSAVSTFLSVHHHLQRSSALFISSHKSTLHFPRHLVTNLLAASATSPILRGRPGRGLTSHPTY